MSKKSRCFKGKKGVKVIVDGAKVIEDSSEDRFGLTDIDWVEEGGK